MERVQNALQAYAAGRLGYDALQREIEGVLHAAPAQGSQVLSTIESAWRLGTLPTEDYARLRAALTVSLSQPTILRPQAPRNAPQTQVPVAEGAPSAAPDGRDDRTRLRPPTPSTVSQSAVPDRTQIRPRQAMASPAAPSVVTALPGAPSPEQRGGPTSYPPPQTPPHTFTTSMSPSGAGDATGGAFTGMFPGADALRTEGPTGQWERPHDWTGVWTEPVEGVTLKGRYYLERKIGQGGMGIVFRARDMEGERLGSEELLAIKVLTSEFRSHPDALKALHEEVRKSRTLAHPNIVSVYTFDRDGQNVFMAMEYLEGKSVAALIDEDYARGMPFSSAWPIIEGMGKALAYAHDRGIVHSDFKPSNVFVTVGGKAKVIDFGIARAARGTQQGRFDAAVLGAMTPGYASCEMLEDQAPDPRDDVFALGCVIYELLSGRHPFNKRPATEARDSGMTYRPIETLTRRQNKALARALAFSREERTPSVESLLHELQAGARSLPRAPLIAAGAVAAVAVLAAGGWWLATREGTDADEAFVESLLQPTAQMSDEYDPDLVQTLFELAEGYLEDARRQYNPEILSEGVSSAYGSYRNILELDPANRQAAEGILEVLKLHRAEARRLYKEKQYRRALEVTGYALKVAPNSAELQALRADITQRLEAETTS